MALSKIEIITPVYNRRDETLQCLRSIARADKTGLDVHIIVVDDGSTDGMSEAVTAAFPNVEIVRGDGTLWYTAGTNRGFTAALRRDPDYILAINNDSIFDEKCLINLVNCAKKYPRSVVGGLLLNWEAPHRIFQVSPRWELLKGGFRHWNRQTVWTIPNKPWEVELIVGNCVLYPVNAIKEVGFMDEKRLPQFGDAEYTPRMRKRGWRLLVEPRARVFCKPNEIVAGFRKLSLTKQIDHLFLNRTSPYSIRRRIYGSLGGAPNLLQGMFALPVFIGRILIGRSQESSWSLTRKEPPLSQTYASAVVDD